MLFEAAAEMRKSIGVHAKGGKNRLWAENLPVAFIVWCEEEQAKADALG